MQYMVCFMLAAAGIVHLLPLSGVLGSEQLASLYGLSVAEPNLAILMRHRAVLFGLIGSFLLYAAFKPALRSIAFLGAIISVASFLALAATTGNYNAQIDRVFLIDVVLLAGLVLGALGHVHVLRKAG